MAAKAASITKYDSKIGVSGSKNYVRVTLLIEAQKGRYATKASSAKDIGQDLEAWFDDGGYDGAYGRYRVQAETLKESEFETAYKA